MASKYAGALDTDTSTTTSLVAQKQQFLETFFSTLGHFAYDKAKDDLHKEDQSVRANPCGQIWLNFLTMLEQLAVTEKNYTSLNYFEQRWFTRKEMTAASYNTLMTEFENMSKSVDLDSQVPLDPDMPQLHKLIAHLCVHLKHFAKARLETMKIMYEKLVTEGCAGRCDAFTDIMYEFMPVSKRQSREFHHPILSCLKINFDLEKEIIQSLLYAQFEMSRWRYLPALIRLHDVHARFEDWHNHITQKDTRRSFISSNSKTHPMPPLYTLLMRLKEALLAKFSLYFHDTLSTQSTPPEMKSLMAKNSIDHYHKIATFQRKHDAEKVLVVLDIAGFNTYQGHGYYLPNNSFELPIGVDSYPAVVSVPPVPVPVDPVITRRSLHWPNIVALVTNKAGGPFKAGTVNFFHDKYLQDGSSYYITRLEDKIYFIIIFEVKKSQKDQQVINFMDDFSSHLRLTKVFQTYKQT